MKSVTCGNCGRPYRPEDGIVFQQGSCNSILYMRGLFTGHADQVLCPACDSALALEPGVLVFGSDPPAAYLAGGDMFTNEQTLELARDLRARAADEDREVDVHTFESRYDLLIALIERLRTAARALTPLNAANAKGELSHYMAAHWRTISPEVLVASDVVTLFDRLGKDSEEERQAGKAYFEAHAEALGRLQALAWSALSAAHSEGAPSTEHALEDDLTRYVDGGVLFNTAVASIEEEIRRHEVKDGHGEKPLFIYCLHAVLARARKAQDESNALGDSWTRRWMEFEFLLRDEEPGRDVRDELTRLPLLALT